MAKTVPQFGDRSLWLKLGAFALGAWLIGKALPANPGIRVLAFVIVCILLVKSLEKK
jgi:hypothetical protein